MEKILVETSARHIHITEEQFKILCGEDASLNIRAYLSQPGQFVSDVRLDVVGPKNTISRVSILGPFRNKGQVEMSLTDCRTLGVSAPIRESGDLKGSAPIILRGPKGEISLEEGLIVAKRHIHMTSEDAKNFNVSNGDIVSVKVETEERQTIFSDVVIRVRDDFKLAMHIDTDEANAANCKGEVFGTIIKEL